MPKFIDLTGKQFGYLTVIKRIETKHQKTRWLCKCKCGKYATPITHQLLHHPGVPSCGCWRYTPERLKTTHQQSKTRLYRIWGKMKQRCNNPKEKSYYRYGGKGIKVCDEWNDKFEPFYEWAVNNGYQDDLSIDRIDCTKGYSPNNCRWATNRQQNNNKTVNIYLTHNGETKTLKEWCEALNFPYSRASNRVKKMRNMNQSELRFDVIFSETNFNARPVLQYDINGNLIKRWSTVLEASKSGFKQSGIICCCRGKQKTHRGYIWKYEDPTFKTLSESILSEDS